MHYTNYILLSMLALSSLSFAAPNKELKKWVLEAKEECDEKLLQASKEHSEWHLKANEELEEFDEREEEIERQHNETTTKLLMFLQMKKEQKKIQLAKDRSVVKRRHDKDHSVAAKKQQKTVSEAVREYNGRAERLTELKRYQMQKEKDERDKQYQMMLLFALASSDLPLRPATEADFGLRPRNKSNKECPQAKKQKTPKKWNQTKRVQQPRKTH